MSNPPTVEQCLVPCDCSKDEVVYRIHCVLLGFLSIEDFEGVIAIIPIGPQGSGKSFTLDKLNHSLMDALPSLNFCIVGGDRSLLAMNKTYDTSFKEDEEVQDLAAGLPEWVKPKPKSTVGVAHGLAQVQVHDFVCKRSGPCVVATDNTNPTPDSASGYIAALPADIVKVAVILQPEFTPDEKPYVDKLLKIKHNEECSGNADKPWIVKKALKPAVNAMEAECFSLWELLHQSDNCDDPVATAYTMLQVLTHTQEWIDCADVSIVFPGHRK